MRRLVAAVAVSAIVLVGIPTASLAQGTPRPGAPCPRAGMTYQVDGTSLVCKKRKGKLVWVVTSTSGGGGSGDIRDQKPPINGVWQTLPGYPTDVPPPFWRGEPASFKPSWELLTSQPVGRPCPSKTPLTHLATDLANLKSLTPQGYMQPGSHATPVPHMYYNTIEEPGNDSAGFATVTRKVNVYAPADMVLRGVATSLTRVQDRTRTEYILNFSICGTLWFFTSHITDLNAQIVAALPKAPRQECYDSGYADVTKTCIYSYMSRPMSGGQLIGRSSGYAHGFDFGLADASGPVLGKLDPGAFEPRWSTSRCHIDYYPADKRAELLALVGGNNGCGQLVSDKAGTVAGVWTAVGQRANTLRENLHIALARHWADKDLRVISVGWEANIPGLPGGRYTFTPTSAGNNRDFTAVKPGDVVCYDNLILESTRTPGVAAPSIFVTMSTGSVETLRIAGVAGACPAAPAMPADYQTFERRNTLT